MQKQREYVREIADQKDNEMAKSEDKDVEIIHFPAFDPVKAADQLHSVAQTAEQWSGALLRVTPGAEDAQKMLKTIFENTAAVGIELSLKGIATFWANAEADLSHLQALVGAKLPSQFIALQSTFLRKRVELFVEQAKQFQALGTRGVADVNKPAKNALDPEKVGGVAETP
ncbi:phasin family protein [Mesorhizobium australicum]|uniref:phasin family protein n=1 Tax=Mesorhizobium australicum TaxID=536018 RepID=UPI00333D4CBA